MKILKEKLIAVVLVGVLLLTGLFAIGQIPSQKANADPSGYNGEEVYYFTDYYSLISYDEFHEEFPKLDIFFDRQYIDGEEFTNMVDNGYFDMIARETYVIIDIKTFMPDAEALKELFSDLINRPCRTIFVSSYNINEYPNVSFLPYVNRFIYDGDFARLRNFLRNSFIELDEYKHGVYSTSYLFDSNLVDVKQYFRSNMDALCATSPFLRVFLQEMSRIIGGQNNSYAEIARQMKNQGMHIFVLFDTDMVVDISDWEIYGFHSAANLISIKGTRSACAYGFWYFTDGYYQILHDIQYVEKYDMPIYALMIDPTYLGHNGLRFTSDAELTSRYGNSYPEEAEEALWAYLLERL